jgi:hypothetical protein
MSLENLFENLWDQYSAVNVQAGQIHSLLRQRGDHVMNDHIAFRTFGLPKVGIDTLASFFIRYGYEFKGTYEFKTKKLRAVHYEKKDCPRIFISELKVEEFSPFLQNTVKELVDAVPITAVKNESFLYSGILWPSVNRQTYLKLLEESEYCAWMSIFGYVANHFTIDVNHLDSFSGIEELNEFVKSHGFLLNCAGGEVKGTLEQYLLQSSTLASEVRVNLSGEECIVPGCYYEFAERFKMPNGELFNGFIEASADKILESTDVKR